MSLLGIDVGTSGAKAALFSTHGELISSAHASYHIIHPAKGELELDPDQVLGAVMSCLSELAQQAEVSKVTALAVSTQGEAIIPVDTDGNAMMNAVLTFDSRNVSEFEWFSGVTDRADIMRRTGMPAHPMFSATKILWLKKSYPVIYAKTWKLMCFGDFISFKLGAASAMDQSMAARTMLFNFKSRCWDSELLELCGIDKAKLPEVVPAGAPIGFSGPALTALGYPKQLKIIAGGHDQICCCLGAGVLRGGMAMDSLGTTESIVCVSETLSQGSGMLENNIPVYPYPVGGMYAYMTFLTCCASLLKWFKCKVEYSDSELFYMEYDAYISEHCRGPSGLFVLPYFAGAGTPSMDFCATGVIAGLTLDTDRYQIYKALLESTCFEQKRNLINMERCGIGIDELRCIGGGSASEPWLQLKADITGKRVVSMECGEAGCLGAAILAGLGSGELQDIEEAERRFVRVKREYLPSSEMTKAYRPHYEEYERLRASHSNAR